MVELYFGDLLVLENGIISPIDAAKELTLWDPEANENTVMILINTTTNTLYWIGYGRKDIVSYNPPVSMGTYLLLLLDGTGKVIPINIPREGFNREKLATFGKLIFRIRFYVQQTTINDIPEDVIRKISTDQLVKEKLTDAPVSLTPNQVNAIIEAAENTRRRIKLIYEQMKLVPGEKGDRERVIVRGRTRSLIDEELLRIIDLLVQYPKLYTTYLLPILDTGYTFRLLHMALDRGAVDLFKVIWSQLPEYDATFGGNGTKRDIDREKSNQIERKLGLILYTDFGLYPELLRFVTPFLLNMGNSKFGGDTRLNRSIHILSQTPANAEYRNAARNTLIYLAQLNNLNEGEIAEFLERFDSNPNEDL